MKLSIITTLYYSAPYINEFYERCLKSIPDEFTDYEFIFVNDGSPDNSLVEALFLYELDNKIKIIDLSRNFGHHKAIMTGLQHCTGDYVFLIDVDLEEEPELLELFWAEHQNNPNVDVVFGVQDTRKGGWFEKQSGQLFYTLFNWLSDTPIKPNMTTVRLMNQNYIKNLIRFQESELLLGGLFNLAGFIQKECIIKKFNASETTYSLDRKISLAINAVVSFSSKPLTIVFNLGLFMTVASLLFIVYLLTKKIFFGVAVGWTSIIASIWFLGGLILFSIGITGIYLSKIFKEVKQRPNTIIRTIYDKTI